jgi:hypothetical protein
MKALQIGLGLLLDLKAEIFYVKRHGGIEVNHISHSNCVHIGVLSRLGVAGKWEYGKQDEQKEWNTRRCLFVGMMVVLLSSRIERPASGVLEPIEASAPAADG